MPLLGLPPPSGSSAIHGHSSGIKNGNCAVIAAARFAAGRPLHADDSQSTHESRRRARRLPAARASAASGTFPSASGDRCSPCSIESAAQPLGGGGFWLPFATPLATAKPHDASEPAECIGGVVADSCQLASGQDQTDQHSLGSELLVDLVGDPERFSLGRGPWPNSSAVAYDLA